MIKGWLAFSSTHFQQN